MLERNMYQLGDGFTMPLHEKCKKYKYHHVFLTMTDGYAVDGIIENVDNESIIVLVGW
jgi:hypothetical protein